MRGVWLSAYGGIVSRATVAGRDDDRAAQKFAGLFEEIEQELIDVNLAAARTYELPLVEMLRNIAHALNIAHRKSMSNLCRKSFFWGDLSYW